VIDDSSIGLLFADDGAGMPEEVLRRVFDPFFTTKMGQGGTGLGMNIV
jgi:signal transduction histidine kinase